MPYMHVHFLITQQSTEGRCLGVPSAEYYDVCGPAQELHEILASSHAVGDLRQTYALCLPSFKGKCFMPMQLVLRKAGPQHQL